MQTPPPVPIAVYPREIFLPNRVGDCATSPFEMACVGSARTRSDGALWDFDCRIHDFVFLDVLTREIRYPFLWLQLVTTGFFGWGVFIGMATATRRMDHLNLVEITKRMSGPKRTFMEVFNRLVVLAVGLAMLVFGIQNFFNDLGSYRAPSLIPLGTYTASVPVAGALIVLFTIEQLVCGLRHGFEGPEDADDFAGVIK